MITRNLKKHIKRKSFRPFTLATTDGRRFHISVPERRIVMKKPYGVVTLIAVLMGAILLLQMA